MAKPKRKRSGSKHCVKAGKKTVRCFRSKSAAKKLAKSRRSRGLKARVVKRSGK